MFILYLGPNLINESAHALVMLDKISKYEYLYASLAEGVFNVRDEFVQVVKVGIGVRLDGHDVVPVVRQVDLEHLFGVQFGVDLEQGLNALHDKLLVIRVNFLQQSLLVIVGVYQDEGQGVHVGRGVLGEGLYLCGELVIVDPQLFGLEVGEEWTFLLTLLPHRPALNLALSHGVLYMELVKEDNVKETYRLD